MKLYADAPGRRARQITGDLLLVIWVVAWIRLAMTVRDRTLLLARPGEQLSQAGAGLADQLRSAGRTVGELPLVGDEARTPFLGAGDAADRIASAGDAQAAAATSLALWLAVAVAAVPILLALVAYLPRRWRFARRASAGQRFLDASADLDLFALRAMAHQPLQRLATISSDPVGAWRDGNAEVIVALAELELADVGLHPPSARPGWSGEAARRGVSG